MLSDSLGCAISTCFIYLCLKINKKKLQLVTYSNLNTAGLVNNSEYDWKNKSLAFKPSKITDTNLSMRN